VKTTVGQLSEATFWYFFAQFVALFREAFNTEAKKRGVNRPLTKTDDAPGLTLLGEDVRLFLLAGFIATTNRASQAVTDPGLFQIYANSFV
jgi:hypothetical protein